MAVYIRGTKVDNAEHYYLYRKSGTSYIKIDQVAQPTEDVPFEFNLTNLRKSGKIPTDGRYEFVVQARANDYESSEYSNVEEWIFGSDGKYYTLTINPTPSSATVKINGSVQSTITIPENTDAEWRVSASGYVSQEGLWTATADETLNITLVKESGGETKYTITYKYISGSTPIKTQTTEQVTAGTTKVFSTSDSRAQVSGYTCTSVSPSGTQIINGNTEVVYGYAADVPNEPESGGGTTGSPIWYITSLNDVAATGKDVTGGTTFTGSSIAPVALDETFNAKLVGKTIDMVEFVPEKAGTIHFGVYNTTTYAYTSKASITVDAADLNTRKTYTFTPFAINSGEAFTYYQSGDTGCMSYYLSKDVPGVEYCNGLRTKCNGAAPSAFNYDIITLFNVGNSSAGSGSGGSSGGETPVGTTWYIQSLQQLQDSGNDIAANKVKLQSGGSGYSWAFNQLNAKLEGKTINTIELMPCAAGSFSVGVFNPSTNTVSNKKTFTVAETDINTIKTYYFEDLIIPTGQYFVWNCSGVSSGEAVGYYILKAKLDPLAVETSNWYQAKSTGLVAFGTHELVFVANIGYTAD